MKFTLTDDYDAVLGRLFTIENGDRVGIGTARSREPVEELDELREWIPFSDFIMEGFVIYELRLLKKPEGCVLEVRFAGTNRDRYIPLSIRNSIKHAGIKVEQG